MIDILYSIIIFPAAQVIELFYLFAYRVSKNPAMALFAVSAAVSILTLPLYLRAEKWQEAERADQKRSAPKIAKIRAVFRGDERYMILSTLYRQNHYHPVYALRGSLGILIQVPFFIAAYSFIGGLESLQGVSFLFIADLSKPDAFLALGGIRGNALPVLMTLINCASGAIYAKGLQFRDKAQLFGMAAIFLVLLYNSPAALVLYWTTNNVFSLVKNILLKIKNRKSIIYACLCAGVLLFDTYILFFHPGYIVKRAIVSAAASLLLFLPFLSGSTGLAALAKNKLKPMAWVNTAASQNKTFFLAVFSLFLLTGIVIPSALISSSVSEFAFLDNYSSPFPFIVASAVQAAGIFLFWPLGIYFLFSKKIRLQLTVFIVLWFALSLVNVFLFPGNYGFLTNTLLFSNPGTWAANMRLLILNCLALFAFFPFFVFLLASPRCKTLFFSVQIIAAISLFCFAAINIININRQYRELARQKDAGTLTKDFSPVYSLSRAGKNVVIIMLDRAISGFVPYMFAEKDELAALWSGFTWYPNCASFSGWTLFSIPAIAGGYEYTPLRMQENPKPLAEKHNEALLLLPRIFSGEGYAVSITDPSWANYGWTPDLSIFDHYPNIHAENISQSYAAYADTWLRSHPEIKALSVPDLLKERLIRFSFFKTAPVFLRIFMYDRGDWLTVNDRDVKEKRKELTLNMIGKYAALDYLPWITALDNNQAGGLAMIYNELTHDAAFLQAPGYVPAAVVTDRGKSPFANDAHYHVSMAAFLLLGKWYTWLKENNAYNNTRIIVASDHGWNIDTGGFILPGGNCVEKYIALLMVKDFDANGELSIDRRFMTQADVPHLALNGIIDNPINPFSGNPVEADKQNGIYITTSSKFYPTKHGKYRYNIGDNEWFHVHDDIFDPENWVPAKAP